MDIATITSSDYECENIKTIKIDWKPDTIPEPGQFVMVWLPGVDEIPMSLSCIYEGYSITVQKVGMTTDALHALIPGNKIGIRGPYGNGFDVTGQDILFVGGGVGSAPLMPALEMAIRGGKKTTMAIGGKRSCDLAFLERLDGMDTTVFTATDDGSKGYKGFVTGLVEDLLAANNFDQIMACGPEPMLFRLLDIADNKKIPGQFSLERYMKCGIGICGSCDIDGLQVCRDGPVFDTRKLKKLTEFGKFKRDETGKKIGF